MNKTLAIVGSIAGALSAVLLIAGTSSIDSLAGFPGCTAQAGGVTTSRNLNWSGGDAVEISIPGSVHFTVGPEWRAVATGPADVLARLRMDGGRIKFEPSFNSCGSDVKIELVGPAVARWSVHGSGDLVLAGLNQDVLDINVTGSGSAHASGSVRETRAAVTGSGDLNLDNLLQQRIELEIHGSGSANARGNAERARIAIFGSGEAYFGKLEVQSASVRIHGSGDVYIAPQDSIDAQIHGSGDVHLLAKPKQVQRRIHGSGEVIEVGG